MEVFEKAFNWLADLSSQLPPIPFKVFFIIVIAVIVVLGVIVALTLLASSSYRLQKACKRISKYLQGIDTITDDNLGDFTNACFNDKTPQTLRDAWAQFVGVRFGYPSEIISEQSVYDKEVKYLGNGRANIFISIALILVALFAFWGFGTLEGMEMGVIHCIGLLLSAVVYLVICILSRAQTRKSLQSFDSMLEDLDAKVYLQVDSNYALDSSPLQELVAMADAIVARNTAKEIDIDDDKEEIDERINTPIEDLIDDVGYDIDEVVEEDIKDEDDIEQASIDDLIDENEDDEVIEEVDEIDEEPQEEIVDEDVDNDENEEVVDEVVDDEVVDEESQKEIVDDEQVDEVQVDEIVEDEQEDTIEEEPSNDEVMDVEESVNSHQEEVAADEVDDDSKDVEDGLSESIEEMEEPTQDVEENVVEDPADTIEELIDEEQVEEQEEQQEEPQGENAVEEQQNVPQEPEVVEVVEGEEEEPHAKPSKFANLPNLVDYMLSKNLPKAMKIQIASMLIGAYNKAKTSEDRKIVRDNLTKVIINLQQK